MSIEDKLPQGVIDYVDSKVKGNGSGGRPHFLSQQRDKPALDVVLDIVELAWCKVPPKTTGKIARKFETSYHTIHRLLADLEPFKAELVSLIETTPRRKTFWNRHTDTSDYETVQAYIDHAHRQELKSYKVRLQSAEKVWRALKFRDPAKWHVDDVVAYIKTKSEGAQSGVVDAVRQIAPQLERTLRTGIYREKIQRRKKPIFGKDIVLMHEAIEAKLSQYHRDIFDLHITVGAREGTSNPDAGMCGISWDRFTGNFSKVDDFESKVRSRGIYWRNCPVGLFFHDLPARLRARWESEGKPTTDKLIKGGYKSLLRIYKDIRTACVEYWQGKVEPSLLKEMGTLRPHDADKIHCNLCWEAGISLEVVAGQHIGKNEGLGLVGRGWLSTDTIKKYYLSLTQRSPKYREMLAKVADYAKQFNGGES